ncbi:hypothetical protein BCR35DRAFT_329058 [Leucosporidium creatinivorum]|uniref:RRM domain-containing protein n=1 Tax=Leucosporidium creatinivorum TaxID=106004 RepID=A0A1Y2FZQ9_9BASI|nr:hypothetical protein BCR35DRAFT_329058 [Leucosporidium creatinivorum]
MRSSSSMARLLLLCGASPDSKRAGYVEQLASYLGNANALELLSEWKESGDVWQDSKARKLLAMPYGKLELWLKAGLVDDALEDISAAWELLGRQDEPPTVRQLPERPSPAPRSPTPTTLPSPSPPPAVAPAKSPIEAPSDLAPSCVDQLHRVLASNLPPSMQAGGLAAIFGGMLGFVDAALSSETRTGVIRFSSKEGARRAALFKNGMFLLSHQLYFACEADLKGESSSTQLPRGPSPPQAPRAPRGMRNSSLTRTSQAPDLTSDSSDPRGRLSRIYIGNLAPSTTLLELETTIDEVVGGYPVEVRIDSKSYGRYAFARLRSEQAAELATSKLHGFILGGRSLVVERPHDTLIDVSFKDWPFRLLIHNIPMSASFDDVARFVNRWEPNAWGLSVFTGEFDRFAYFNVPSDVAVERAINEWGGNELSGRRVKISRAGRELATNAKEGESEEEIEPFRRSRSPRSPSPAFSPQAQAEPLDASQKRYFHLSSSPTSHLDASARLELDSHRISTLPLHSDDLRSIHTLWAPLSPPPSPAFSRTITISASFGHLSPSDAADAVKLPTPSFLAKDKARKARYEGWLRSQMGEKGRHLALVGQIECFKRCQEEFERAGQEDAREEREERERDEMEL